MSQENVEAVKTFFAAFAERDFAAGARFLDPAVEIALQQVERARRLHFGVRETCSGSPPRAPFG